MICAVAQEESLSISQNMKWGIHKRMQNGTYVNASTPFGYRQENHKLVPYESEAVTVRFIYEQYLAGKSIVAITRQLNEQFPQKSVSWNAPAVQSILTNEKYRGDTCFQKRYTTDVLPLQKKRNRGELPQYYMQESHLAIISPADFEKVQALLSQKRSTRSPMQKYPLTKMAVCASCGKILYPKVRANGVRIWNCKTHFEDSSKCPVKPVLETELYGAFLLMYSKLYTNCDTLLLPIQADLQQVQRLKRQRSEENNKINSEILRLSKQLHNLARIHAQGSIEETVYQERHRQIEQQLIEKKAQLTLFNETGRIEKMLQQTKQTIRYLQNHVPPTEATEEALRMLVKQILVDRDAFTFVLNNGLRLREERKTV